MLWYLFGGIAAAVGSGLLFLAGRRASAVCGYFPSLSRPQSGDSLHRGLKSSRTRETKNDRRTFPEVVRQPEPRFLL